MDFLDVHSLPLETAKKVISNQIRIAYEKGIGVVHVNHGFNNGRKIKTWCLNQGCNLECVKKVIPGSNEGITDFYIKENITSWLKK